MSLELTQEIKDKIKEIVRTTPNITSVGYGYKVSNGINTGEPSIVYGVEVKKPLAELASEELLPSEVSIANQSVKTDVIQMGKIEPLNCNIGCGENAGAASIPNRSYTRPVKGGLSMTSLNNNNSVGTFGLVVKDVATGCVLGLTNNHVSIADAFYTNARDLNGQIQNDYSPVDNIYQGTEGVGYFDPVNIIGRGVRYVPLHPQSSGLTNNVDAALFALNSSVLSTTESWKQVGLDAVVTDYLPFATTLEIDNLLASNAQLYSSGRTTGPKGGASCPLKAFQLGVTFPINYKMQGPCNENDQSGCTTVTMTDAIAYFKPPIDHPESQNPAEYGACCNPVRGGDSGSALIADIGGTIKIIGLVFAGSTPGCDGGDNSYTYGLACRIDEVASQLGITSWDKGDELKAVNTSTIEYRTEPGGSDQKTKSCDGKTFWQVGLTNTLDNPC
jgi:hypothetical protein